MAGVEENIVYRLLVLSQTGKGRMHKKRGLACYGFPFSAECWRDLDMTLITARDYAQAIWAYRCYPRGFGSRRHLYRIAIAILISGIVGGLFPLAPVYMGCAAFFLSIYLVLEGHRCGIRNQLWPVLPDMVREFRMIRQAKGKLPDAWIGFLSFAIPSSLSVFVVFTLTCLFFSVFVDHLRHIPQQPAPLFIGGAIMILLFGRSLPGKEPPTTDNKNHLFRTLVEEIELLILLRREGDNG